MAKQYIFYKQDIINLLLNYKNYLAEIVIEMKKNGIDAMKFTIDDVRKFTEQFFDGEVERKGVKLENILHEVDEILKKTHGMTTLEVAKKKRRDLN